MTTNPEPNKHADQAVRAHSEGGPGGAVVFLNGAFVLRDTARVSIFDRSFLYGDGLFETLRVLGQRPLLLARHLDRLRRGAAFLGIEVPLTDAAILDVTGELVARNNLPHCVLRITLSRGVGERGYSPRDAGPPTFAMTLHPVPFVDPANPPRLRLVTASVRLPARDPLAAFKTANRLPYVLARAEADRRNADDALLLNTDGDVAEASGANVFWIEHDTLHTPPVSAGILPGITRSLVIEHCGAHGLRLVQETAGPARLLSAAGAFLTSSVGGLIEIASLDGTALPASELVDTLRRGYERDIGVA